MGHFTILHFPARPPSDIIKLQTKVRRIRIAGGIGKVRVDCHALDYISSAGLRVLLIMQKQHGVKLAGVNSTVTEILETTGFDSILEMEE